MAVNITRTPDVLNMAGNNIIAEITSDNAFTTAGVISKTKLIINTKFAAGDTLTIAWNSNSIQLLFDVVSSNYNNYLKLPADDGAIGRDEYTSQLIQYLQYNYQIDQAFIITHPAQFTIQFESREFITGNVEFTHSTPSKISTTNFVEGRLSVLRPFYKIYGEIEVLTRQIGEVIKLKLGADLIDVDSNGKAKFYLQDYIKAFLTECQQETQDYNFPQDNNIFTQRPYVCQEFIFRWSESYGNPVVVQFLREIETFWVTKGGFDFKLKSFMNRYSQTALDNIQEAKIFLNTQPKIKVIAPDATEYLWFLNPFNVSNLYLYYKVYWTDGTYETVNAGVINYDAETNPYSFLMNVFEVNASPSGILGIHDRDTEKTVSHYTVWMKYDPAGPVISEERTFIIDWNEYPQTRNFIYRNSYELIESIRAVGESDKSVAIEYIEHSAIMPDDFTDRDKQSVQERAWSEEVFKVNFGYVKNISSTNTTDPKKYIDAALDFCLSSERYEIDGYRRWAINILSTKINQYKDGDTLYQLLEVEYKRAFKEQYYTPMNAEIIA